MGLAIINTGANYTLERAALNVIPEDPNKRVYLTNILDFSYEYAGNGIYRLNSLNIGNATQPYVYSLVALVGQTGVTVDPISGVVTVSNDFSGGNITIALNAVYDDDYYPSTGTVVSRTTTITNVQTPDDDLAPAYNNLTITSFTYGSNTIAAAGGTSAAPTLTYSYIEDGSTVTTGGTVTYRMHPTSDSGATVNSNGVVTIPANSALNTKTYIVEVKVVVDEVLQTEVAKIVQAAAEATPPEVTYTYAFSNVSLSYTGSPIAAIGNSAGLTPTLNYTLTKTGSDNSTETINASSIVYSVSGTKPSNVTLTASNGKVTFGENGTDNLVNVTIKATLTAPDGTTANPTATINQNPRALTDISFNSYKGSSTTPISISQNTTIYSTDLVINLIYDAGSNGTLVGTNDNIKLGTAGTATSQTFSNTGNFVMVIHHSTFQTNVSITVTAVTKAYISGFPEEPYPTANPIISADGTTVSLPLKVLVMTPGSSTAVEKTFGEFLEMSPRETYDAPVVTFRGEFYDYCIPEKHNMVGTDGTLNYDLTLDNYVYDKTRISSIALNCTSNSNSDCSPTYALSIGMDVASVYSAYFTNSANFTSTELISKPSITDSSIQPTVAEGVTALGGYAANVGIHISNTDTSLTNGLALSSSGYYYKLPQQESYLLAVSGSSCYVGIISTTANSLSSGSTYKLNTWGNNIKVLETHSNVVRYIRHTPDPNTNTFIVDLGKVYPLTWNLLTPTNNE